MSRWLLPSSPLLSFQSSPGLPSSLCGPNTREHARGSASARPVQIRELGFALARHYVVYEPGNAARQGRKSVHGRTGQYLPVKPRCTAPSFTIFPPVRVLYDRLIHFALKPRATDPPPALASYQSRLVLRVFRSFPNLSPFLLRFPTPRFFQIPLFPRLLSSPLFTGCAVAVETKADWCVCERVAGR